MENDTEKKQTYLRENILDKGYSADEFMSFLNSKKGEKGLDLSNWSLEELEQTVSEFITIKNELEKNKIEKQNLEKNSNNINEIVNKNKNLINDQAKRDEEYLNNQQYLLTEPEFIQSILSESTDISETSGVQIKLSSPEKVEGGIFGKSYITYLVETSPLGFKVRKRYSDFEWLRNALSFQYVGCVIPPLCKKNYGDRFTEALVIKRTRLLQKFMEGILIHPLMRNSQIFYDFISCENEEEFENKKKTYNLISPSAARDMKSIDGQVRISVSNEKEIYLDNIKDNADINIKLMKQITKSYKGLITLMQQASEKMKEISELWKKMHEISQRYYETNNTIESYSLMHKIMKSLSDIESKKVDLMNNYIREYFRFVKNEFISLKDLTAKADTNKDIYHKAFDKINSTKEKLFRQKDLNNWQLEDKEDFKYKSLLLKNKKLAFAKMIPEETKRFNDIKYNFGYYLNSVISEYERLRILNSRRHKDHVQIFAKMLIDIVTQFHGGLNDQIYFFQGLKDDEDLVSQHIGYEKYRYYY
jgi:hypothetical protein